MPTSGSVDFSVSRDEIIKDALFEIGALGDSETPTDADIQLYSRYLNRLVKQWMGQSDFAPGLKMWSRKRATLYLQDGTAQYSLGPSGDHWASDPVETTLASTAGSGASTATLTSVSGIAASDYIGIVQDDNTVHWTTVNGAPSGNVVTLTAVTTATATAGTSVYTYTTKARRPLQILTMYYRNQEGQDTYMYPITLTEYDRLQKKDQEGVPYQYYYEAQLTDGEIYFNYTPRDTTGRVLATYLSVIEDFDASTDTPDYPQEWYRALHYGLAVDIWGTVRQGEPTRRLIGLRDEAISIARNANPETSVVFYEPGGF